MNLLSVQTLVESPFIIVKIGDYTFGAWDRKKDVNQYGVTYSVTYPNYMQSLNVVKVNGAVNTYTLRMVYAVTAGDDPNLLERVFGTIADTRKLYISYGDYASPTFIYKEEEAIVSKVQTQVDFNSSKITYTLTCVSNSLALRGNSFDFPMRTAKPSDVIYELLTRKQYGLSDIFYGMIDLDKIKRDGLIASDDKKVRIPAKHSISILDYLNYLVNCMHPASDLLSVVSTASYYLTVVDDVKSIYNGPYFKVTKVKSKAKLINSLDVYDIDIGFPGNNYVTSFNINDDNSWSILYKYLDKLNQLNSVYKIDDQGKVIQIDSPNILTSPTYNEQTPSMKSWWTQVTQFPIQATLVIKGLLRPAILMTYVRLNVVFYGQRHISSGLYLIIRQEDQINESGYRTTLTLQRIDSNDSN